MKKRSDDFVGLTCSLVCLAFLGVAVAIKSTTANAQTPPPKSPLAQPKPTASEDRLKISYLTEVDRGTFVYLRLMSGKNIPGFLINVKSENDVIILEGAALDTSSGKWVGSGNHSFFKATSVAGVTPFRGTKKGH